VMFIEVGLGFYYLVLVHFLGHAVFRTYQILSAGGILHEHRMAKSQRAFAWLPPQAHAALYAFALNRSLGDGSGSGTFVRWIEELSRKLTILENSAVSLLSRKVEAILASALPRYLFTAMKKREE